MKLKLNSLFAVMGMVLVFQSPVLAGETDNPAPIQKKIDTVLIGGDFVNVSGPEKKSMLRVLQYQLYKHGESVRHATEPDISDQRLAEMAENHNATNVVAVEVTRVGSTTIILVRAVIDGSSRTETIRLFKMDDFPIAAERLVEGIYSKQSFNDTATASTLTTQEGRPQERKFGELFWGAGISLGSTLTQSTGMNFGGNLRIAYEMTDWRLDSEFSTVGTSNGNDSNHIALDWTLGAAYLFGEGNMAGYIDGGLGLGFQHLDPAVDNNRTGLGALFYVGGGVEMFRFYDTRLIVGARVVLPAYELEKSAQHNSSWEPSVRLTTTFLW